MSKFKNIEALGIEVLIAKLQNPNERVVLAADLEALLENGVRVYGREAKGPDTANMRVFDYCSSVDTHTGLLIDYKPIPKPKPVTGEELICLINSLLCETSHFKVGTQTLEDIKKRIKDAGVE